MEKAALLIIVPCLVVAVFLAFCFVVSSKGEKYEEPLQVRDRDLLTAEQQRQLVRDGEVSIWVGNEYVTLYNDQENKVYLNEGGAR